MKKMLILGTAMLFSVGANAQVGIKAGYVSSQYKLSSDGYSIKPDAQSGVFAGIDYDYTLPIGGIHTPHRLSLRPGLNYTYVSGKSSLSESFLDLDEDISVRDTEHFITLPVDIKYAFTTNEYRNIALYAFAGPRATYGLISTSTFRYQGASVKMDMYSGKMTATYNGQTETETIVDGGVFRRFDLGLGGGIGVAFGPLAFEVAYDCGIFNRVQSDLVTGNEKITRNQFALSLSYSF